MKNQQQKQNRPNKKFDFKNLSQEQKIKIIGGIVIGVIFCCFMLYGYYSNNNDDNTVEEMTSPEAELSQYNSRMEALNGKRDPTLVNDLEHTFTEPKNSELTEETNFEELDRQIANLGSSSQRPKETPVSSQTNYSTGGQNNHNPYGNYDMWQKDEPKNTNIGYSGGSRKKKSRPQTENYQTISVPTNTEPTSYYNKPTNTAYSEPIKSSNTGVELTKEQRLQQAIAKKYQSQNQIGTVTAEIYNSQKIDAKNTQVRIVLKDRIITENGTIGTDAFVSGIASVNGNNVTISVPNISYKGRNYNVKLVAYDYRTGELGIPIRTDNLIDGETGRRVTGEVLGRAGVNTGAIGGILTNIFNNRNRNVSVLLNDGHKIYLKPTI